MLAFSRDGKSMTWVELIGHHELSDSSSWGKRHRSEGTCHGQLPLAFNSTRWCPNASAKLLNVLQLSSVNYWFYGRNRGSLGITHQQTFGDHLAGSVSRCFPRLPIPSQLNTWSHHQVQLLLQALCLRQNHVSHSLMGNDGIYIYNVFNVWDIQVDSVYMINGLSGRCLSREM